MKLKTSKSKSFSYWSLWEFIKGRKKTAITVVASVIGYFVAGDFPSAIVAGGVVESAFAIVEFYFKKVDIK